METKLVSANMGIVLIVERDGQEKKIEWSAAFPSKNMPQPYDALFYLKEFLEETFGRDIAQQHVPIAKPRKIKAARSLTHNQYNKKKIVEELLVP